MDGPLELASPTSSSGIQVLNGTVWTRIVNSTQLAQIFEETGRHLESSGHLIVVKRARHFLNDGRVDLASAFLLEAKRRMPIDQVTLLCDAFGEWRRNEGDVDALLSESVWIDSTRREEELSSVLAQRTRDIGYAPLMRSIKVPEIVEVVSETHDEIVEAVPELDWDHEPTSEIFEAQTLIYELPDAHHTSEPTDGPPIPDALIVGVITMSFVLTIYFCFFRSF